MNHQLANFVLGVAPWLDIFNWIGARALFTPIDHTAAILAMRERERESGS